MRRARCRRRRRRRLGAGRVAFTGSTEVGKLLLRYSLCVSEFASEEEGVAIANRSRYGLSAALWTSSIDRAHRLPARLRVGGVSVNGGAGLRVETPFGGLKESGYGRDLSLHALDEYSALQTRWLAW